MPACLAPGKNIFLTTFFQCFIKICIAYIHGFPGGLCKAYKLFVSSFVGYPNQKSILGLRFCFVSTMLIGIIGPFLVMLLTLYDPSMYPFLGSLVARHFKEDLSVFNYVLHTIVFFTQHWTFSVYGSLIPFIFGDLFLGMVLCIMTYLHCLCW